MRGCGRSRAYAHPRPARETGTRCSLRSTAANGSSRPAHHSGRGVVISRGCPHAREQRPPGVTTATGINGAVVGAEIDLGRLADGRTPRQASGEDRWSPARAATVRWLRWNFRLISRRRRTDGSLRSQRAGTVAVLLPGRCGPRPDRAASDDGSPSGVRGADVHGPLRRPGLAPTASSPCHATPAASRSPKTSEPPTSSPSVEARLSNASATSPTGMAWMR
jgi:hypothetical protein